MAGYAIPVALDQVPVPVPMPGNLYMFIRCYITTPVVSALESNSTYNTGDVPVYYKKFYV
jgi:hypothetical protein